MVDWLAVASSVPSSAHRCTRPWPNPLATAWMRMSSSTHSVGTSRTTRSVLSRLLPPAGPAERLADAERHVVAEDGEAGARRTGRAGRACGPTAASGRRAPGGPRARPRPRASARRTSMRSMIDSVPGSREPAHRALVGRPDRRVARPTRPRRSSSRVPRAALTVRISVSATWPTARAWVICGPATASVTSMSSIDGGWA